MRLLVVGCAGKWLVLGIPEAWLVLGGPGSGGGSGGGHATEDGARVSFWGASEGHCSEFQFLEGTRGILRHLSVSGGHPRCSVAGSRENFCNSQHQPGTFSPQDAALCAVC